MTGLDLERDVIIEIACIITDGNLNAVQERYDLVLHQPKSVMDQMNDWCIQTHGESGLTKQVIESTLTLKDAEATILDFVKRHIPKQREGVLAGNSVHVDRQFLHKHMPLLIDHLHYRIVDVSSIKEIGMRWYPDFYKKAPKKKLAHRAMGDILESIEELKAYRLLMFKQNLP
ncbi:hypothetical protein BDEG_21238 [Batrachochytrium dendrobatidis JEL423]|nr:hypothetical protein BDEG_21238 [Batrachochytrium dendrobatidis JEL423]